MKQKRKETSCLHSSKQCLNAIGTVTLLGVVCGVLGIISVGLLTKSAIAAGEESTSTVAYTGVDDKVDVVVGLNFIDQDNQSKDLYNFYESGDNLYVTPNNVVVNVTNTNGEIVKNNEVIGSVYGHVLGGEGNKLNSDNVTIIAGSSNEVGAGNTNAVILGGTGNTMGGNEVIALVGGEGNDANKKDGLIIGGNNNTVNGGNGSASVLGGERNEVLGDNAVVGGLGIKMGSDKNNIFAYSNRNVSAGSFTTKSSDAFYLDIQKGLGINLGSTKGGVEMQGAMGFGEIDINQGCNDSSNNYGVQGTWDGCMVGCTKAGGGKWQLLDSSESCKAKCEDDSNGRCVVDVYNPSEVAGKCSDAKVSKTNAEVCEGRNPAPYKDVIFETTLIDSEGNCNGGKLKNNQCVYKCKQGYHLTGDNTGIIKSNDERKQKGMGCYADCTLYALDGTTVSIKHNTVVDGYDSDKEYCAYNDEEKDPASTYTCAGNHKATLMCVDGTFYMRNGSKWVDDQKKHKYQTCTLNQYRCPSNFNLTSTWITSNRKFGDSGSLGLTDRKTSVLTRGEYKLCIDYNPLPSNGKNGYDCSKISYKYSLTSCHLGYQKVDDSNECRGQCPYYENGVKKYDNHGASRYLYKSISETCENTCQGKKVTCDDGTWSDTDYKYSDCSLSAGSSCGSDYSYSSQSIPNSNWDPCPYYTTQGNTTCVSHTKYKWLGCKTGYTGDNCDPIEEEEEPDNPEPEPDPDPVNPDPVNPNNGGSYACVGEPPAGVSKSSKTPDKANVSWFCDTDLNSACAYTCIDGYECINVGKNDGCKNSDNITFLPNMHIDEIKGCKMKYHFNEYDPISGKSCCSPVRLMKSYDESSWQPLTTSYDKNGTTVTSNGKEGMIYFKYSVDGGQTYSSVSSYKMSKQNCSTSCSLQKVDWNGNPFDWEEKTAYYDYGFIWSAPINKYANGQVKTDNNWDGSLMVGDYIWSVYDVYKGYVPCAVNSMKKWCYFENTYPEGKITKVNNYIGDLYKCI